VTAELDPERRQHFFGEFSLRKIDTAGLIELRASPYKVERSASDIAKCTRRRSIGPSGRPTTPYSSSPPSLRQPNIENQQRHRDGEDSIAQRIETDFCEYDDAPPDTSSLFVPWRRRKRRKVSPRYAPALAAPKASGKAPCRARRRLARCGVI
jgi:hypothetical protein